MPKYRTANGSVVERTEAYVMMFPPGTYTLVDDETSTILPCCGESTVRGYDEEND